MNNMQLDVLNLEWSGRPSRDRQMTTLVCNYLRLMGYSVHEGSVFDGYRLLSSLKPHILFISNAIGANNNLELVKYAKSKGIGCITLLSESIFHGNRENVTQLVWGCNQDRILYEDIHMQWSEKMLSLTLKYFPELKGKIKVSGGCGFDLYKISKENNRVEILRRYGKIDFKRIIGIGCWNFGLFHELKQKKDVYLKIYSPWMIEQFKKDYISFNRILLSVIKNNPQVLFLLKEHPSVKNRYYDSAIHGSQGLHNTLIIKDEVSIIDCIRMSDIWLVYDSTTILEAWLLGKQTGLINPNRVDFIRDEIFRGCPNYMSASELQDAINNFYRSGNLIGFSELSSIRNSMIRDMIQWNDGLNHVRVGNEIMKLIDRYKRKHIRHDTFREYARMLVQTIRWHASGIIPFGSSLKYIASKRTAFNPYSFEKYRLKRIQEQTEYYQELELDMEDLMNYSAI